MKFFKLLVDFYINSSIHVALAAISFLMMTQSMFKLPLDNSIIYFAFFGTIVGYNFVKYDALVRVKKYQMRLELKAIVFLSLCSLIATGYFFYQLQPFIQFTALIFLIITILYTLPFFPNKQNARNWAGIKIYIVSLCWVGVTLVLPIINTEIYFSNSMLVVAIQRFIILFVLILIFEIIDLKTDDPNLQTVPQKIGVSNSKKLGSFLLIIFLTIEFFDKNFDLTILLLKAGIAATTFLFLCFANEKSSKYYSSFWVESIPIFWWLLLLIFC
ncbi:MAG: hypothetical protein H7239_01715 [Flavobacterium sp.]|nr:hypothetical protein [Flavobacterium sp.]